MDRPPLFPLALIVLLALLLGAFGGLAEHHVPADLRVPQNRSLLNEWIAGPAATYVGPSALPVFATRQILRDPSDLPAAMLEFGVLVAFPALEEGTLHLEVGQNRVVLSPYRGLAGGWSGDPFPHERADLPNEGEAVGIARDYLGSLSFVDVDRHDLSSAKFTYQTFGPCSTTTGCTRYATAMDVRFARTIEGLPVVGPGGKLNVDLGDGGEVIGFSQDWPPLAEAETRRIIDVQTAIDRLNEGRGSVQGPTCDQVVAERIQLAYYVPSLQDHPAFAFPVYRIDGRCVGGGPEDGPLEAIVSAV